MEAMPLTSNGKLDRKALPKPEIERRDGDGALVEPRTAAEEKLAAIWKQVLRLDRVGIHDNFFELGGDSILSIQVIARANEAGLRLTPKQLFQNQTIAQLAEVAGTAAAIEAEQWTVTGEVPLAPIQRWFFEHELAVPEHWNQALVFELRRPVDPGALESAMRAVIAHHDALRLRVDRVGDEWRMHNAADDESFALRVVDIAGVEESGVPAIMAAEGAELQASIRFDRGSMLRM